MLLFFLSLNHKFKGFYPAAVSVIPSAVTFSYLLELSTYKSLSQIPKTNLHGGFYKPSSPSCKVRVHQILLCYTGFPSPFSMLHMFLQSEAMGAPSCPENTDLEVPEAAHT